MVSGEGLGMSAIDVLEDNVMAKNDSFLYYLHEKSEFNREAFKQLCLCIRELADVEVGISRTAQNINFVYGQVLKYFMYHFDKNDEYKISKMPESYNKLIEYLDKNVEYYFQTRI